MLSLVLFQGFLSRPLKAISFFLAPNFYYGFTVYLACFSAFYYLADFPLRFYSSFILERKFKLSNQRFSGWLKDEAKSAALSLPLFLVFMQVLYVFLRHFERTWWIWIALFWFFATIIIAKIAPIIIMPLFYKYSRLEESIKKKVIALSKKCGIRILNVYKIDFSKKTNKLNAAVTGLGRTRRVVLADNLVRDFTGEEIDGVLAHEFGHHRFRHMWKLMIFGLISTFFSFFVVYLASPGMIASLGGESMHDIKIFPAILIVLFITGFITLPAQNAFSRKLEREADIFALKVTKNKPAFISLMNKLAQKNLADPSPSKLIKLLFYSHPPISDRIRLAKTPK